MHHPAMDLGLSRCSASIQRLSLHRTNATDGERGAAYEGMRQQRGLPSLTSPGEKLWYSLRKRFTVRHADPQPGNHLDPDWADPAGRLRRYTEDVLVSASCTRLITKASGHLSYLVPGGGPRDEPTHRESTIRAIKQFCVDPLGMSFMDRAIDHFALLAFESAVSAAAEIPSKDRKAAYREAAQRNGGRVLCYLCAAGLGQWDLVQRDRDIPLDHLWPRAFGGVSYEENLLPICDRCNGLKKDRITWDVYGTVHDYALSHHSASGRDLTRMALHRRAATKLAEDDGMSLKEAFSRLGPLQNLIEIAPDEPNWFFNQSAHDVMKLGELW